MIGFSFLNDANYSVCLVCDDQLHKSSRKISRPFLKIMFPDAYSLSICFFLLFFKPITRTEYELTA